MYPAPTHDLRSPSIDYKRDATEKAKWAHKWTCSNRRTITKLAPDGTNRPDPAPVSRGLQKKEKRENARGMRKRELQRKRDPWGAEKSLEPETSDDGGGGGDVPLDDAHSSDEDRLVHAGDSQRALTTGCGVLGLAVTKAVQKFEDGQTTKLVRDEYDIIEVDHDSDQNLEVANMDDDDYELV